jgi:hypothetical protein
MAPHRLSRALLMLAVAAAACAGSSVETHTYATLAEAQPAVERGWIPAGLPASSFEVRAAHAPGGWQRWGLFNFLPDGEPALRAFLQPEEISLAGVRCDVPGRLEWWPVQLRHDLDAERIAATGAKAYRSRTGNLIVVVNWPQRRAYYWTTG